MKRWLNKYWAWLAGGLLIVMIVTPLVWYFWNLRPANAKAPEPVAIGITKGQHVPEIATQLQQMGIIRSRLAFEAYVTLHGLRRKIEAGFYELSPADSTAVNAKIIARGIVVNKAFLVREGETIQQIQDQATQDWLRGADLPQALAAAYPNAFLAGRPAGASLEGYLFPDTYEISPSTTPQQLVQAMLNNFSQKVTPQIQAGLAQQGLTLSQGITLASMVEGEAAQAGDRPIVAQVFLSRLRSGMMLQSSVTGFYGAKLLGLEGITEANVASVSSPYNTYIHAGLPPGPINNPGLASIEAVAHPSNTNYLYFVADSAGHLHFATTFAEHQANVAKYK